MRTVFALEPRPAMQSRSASSQLSRATAWALSQEIVTAHFLNHLLCLTLKQSLQKQAMNNQCQHRLKTGELHNVSAYTYKKISNRAF